MADATEDVAAAKEPEKVKARHNRVRKKSVLKGIAKQMDVYFADSNLLQDRFLQQEIEASADGYVPLGLFQKFNKIRAFGVTNEDIAKAVSHFSTMLTLNDAKDMVKRTTPLASREEVDQRSVYVEGIPLTATHDWVISTLSKYDKVNYVFLPKFPSTHQLKGFAFVEFATPEGAKSCLDAIGTEEFSSLHPFPKAGSKDIKRLEKITSKQDTAESPQPKKRNKKRNAPAAETTVAGEGDAEKTEAVTAMAGDGEPASKKLKGEEIALEVEQPAKISKKRKRKSSHSKSKDESETKVAKEASKDSKEVSEDTKEASEVAKEAAEVTAPNEKAVVKSSGKKSKQEQNASKKEASAVKKDTPGLKAISKVDWVRLKHQYTDLQKANLAALKQKNRERKAREESLQDAGHKLEKLEMIPNVVVEVKAMEVFTKDKLRSCLPDNFKPSYIDVAAGQSSGYIRCKTQEDASELLEKTCGDNYQLSMLQGEAEVAYWESLNEQRIANRSKASKTKRSTHKKGSKKVVDQHVKANKSKHIVFDED